MARPTTSRDANGHYVVIFYRWLKENRFELLKTGHGDPYQHLKVDLLGLIE